LNYDKYGKKHCITDLHKIPSDLKRILCFLNLFNGFDAPPSRDEKMKQPVFISKLQKIFSHREETKPSHLFITFVAPGMTNDTIAHNHTSI
jgi:hypothetical protein